MSKPYQYLHTTEKTPQQSASEAMHLLSIIGASNISMDFSNGELVGMTFQVRLGERVIAYRLPVRCENIAKTLLAIEAKKTTYWRRKEIVAKKVAEQAKRTAWRLMLEWLKVQTAFVENGVRHPAEVFLADMIVKTGDGIETTVGTMMLEHGSLPLLGSASA